MHVVVKDACVLIDLANGEILGHWFQLGHKTHTTDIILSEIRREEQWAAIAPIIDSGLIHVHEIVESEWNDIFELSSNNTVSIPDATALLLAENLEALLLTGDGPLRRLAEQRAQEVRGTLWILDTLVWEEVLTFSEAISALDSILKYGARLPIDKCSQRNSAWKQRRKIKPRIL